jgi:hypothetical protein
MNAIFKRLLIAACAGCGAVVIVAAYFVYTRFYRYQPAVDVIVHSIPNETRDISPQARDVFQKLDGKAIPWIDSKYLLGEVAPARVSMTEWHFRGALWNALLPTRLNEKELMAVYCQSMYLGDVHGIAAGAKSLYNKKPNQLSTEDSIRLVTIFRRPSLVRQGDPRALNDAVARMRARYQSAAN